MPHKLTLQPNHTVLVDAHLDAEAVASEREHILRDVRRRARVPGFRPGKAPLAAVKSRYGDEIRSELEEHLSGMLWREVLDSDQPLDPLTRPEMRSLRFEEDGSFHLSASLEVRPSYQLPELAGVELPELGLTVAEHEIDAELETIRKEQATWEPADEAAAEDGMLVEADLHGEIEGGEEPYTEDGARFVLGDDGVPPAINEALQGAAVGDERVAEKRFPDDDADTHRAGKIVRYTIAVKSLKNRILPEIDDDLAATIGLESIAELRDRIAAALAQRKRAERRDRWRRHLLDHLEGGIDLNDLPSSLVQSALSEDLHRVAYTMAMRGVRPDSGEIDWQELSAKLEPEARRRVVDTLVLEQLADQWQVEVPEHDVDAHIAAEAVQRGVPPAEHKSNLAKEGKLEQLRHAARTAATVDELIRRAGGEVE